MHELDVVGLISRRCGEGEIELVVCDGLYQPGRACGVSAWQQPDLHAVLTDRQLTTVIVLVGHYMTVARLTGILQVALDESPGSWTHEH